MARYDSNARFPDRPSVPEQGHAAPVYEAPPLPSRYSGEGHPGRAMMANVSETMPGEGTHGDAHNGWRTPQC